MTHPAPEDPLAALREEIRRAGQTTWRLRLEVVAMMALLVLLGLPSCGGIRSSGSTPPADYVLYYAGPSLFLVGVVGLLAANPYATCYRWLRARQLRRRLESLPREGAISVLEPLTHDGTTDTRQLARDLTLQLGLPTEVTPAGAPAGSGAEVSGVTAGDE